MPLAVVELRRGPTPLERLDHSPVGVADHAPRLAGERGEKGAPVVRMGAREGLRVPQPRLARAESDRAEDVEGNPSTGDPDSARVLGSDPEGQVVERQRALGRPGGRSMKREDDRCEQLHPVGDELAVGGLAHLAGLRVEAEAPGPSAGHPRGLPGGSAGPDGGECLGDSAGDELVVARGLRTLAPLDLALAVLAGSVPGLLAREKLGEDVGRSLPRRALVALGSVTGRAVGAVELDPSVDVLGLRHLALAALTLGIPPRLASRSDALAP